MFTPRSGHGLSRLGTAGALLLLVAVNLGAAPRVDHVVLISIDGLRPEFYLDPAWPAPMIQQMAREGAAAERVRSVFPSVTYPAHTTMITGALPARHGIYYNEPFEPEGQSGRWFWEESAIRTATLWDALRAGGRTTVGVSWPVTVGAPIDYFLPEVWAIEPGADRLAPMREGTYPATLWNEIEREATGRLSLRTFNSAYISRDDVTGVAAAYLLETYLPAFMAVHLISADHFQHLDGRDSDRVRRSVSAADRAIAVIVEAADRAGILGRTAFVVTGDHGFVDINLTLAPNVWLARAGLMEARPDRGRWRATFHTSGGAATLILNDPKDTEAVERVRRILAELPTRTRGLFRVVDREELERIGADPGAPLALAGSIGVSFSNRAEGDALAPASGGTHGFFPTDFPEIYTGMIGWGAGFRPGVRIHEMGLEDIAPLIAELLGIPFDAPDGVAPLGVLTPAQD